MRQILLITCSLLLISCTEEITRLDLTKHSSTIISIYCEKDQQIDFYLDGDLEFKEEPLMVMDFEFFKGNEQVLKGGLDPLAISSVKNESKVEQAGKIRWKFYGKLEGNFIPSDDTVFQIKPTLIINKESDLKLNKFDLVFVR